MEEKTGFSGSESSVLRVVLREMGFWYRKFLMERRDTVATRMEFLRTKHNIRLSGNTWPIFHLDEMWVNQNHSLKYIWQDSNMSGGLKVTVWKKNWIPVCHDGCNEIALV
jgi:hypothetical protein